MAFNLSTTAEILSKQTNIQQQIILEIDGIPLVFGAVKVTKLWRIGDDANIGDVGLVIGGNLEDPNSRAYISVKGTTNNITQQLEIDKGGSGSIQKFNVQLIDKGQELTRLFTAGEVVDDLLFREANVYLSFIGGSHPEDSIRIFNGIIEESDAGQGYWKLGIAHPESAKRQQLFDKVSRKLSGAISAGQTTMTLDDTTGFLEPLDALTTYVRVDDEIIGYQSVSGNQLLTLERGALGSTADTHDDEATVESFYRLQGDGIDLALKLMLSRKAGFESYTSENDAPKFVQVSPTQTTTDGILIEDFSFKDDVGAVVGDLVTITGAVNAQNNITNQPITSFTEAATGTVIVVGGAGLVSEIDSDAVLSIKSKYNTLPSGCNMTPSQVDIEQHETLKLNFPSSVVDYDFYLKDSIDAKEFITNELYFPSGFYQVPRKARASVNFTNPPLVQSELKEITEANVKRADNLKIKRSVNKNFFNSVVYKFNDDTLEDKFLAGEIIFSQRSINRIPAGNKPLTIESKGLRDTAEVRNYVKAQARRFSDRYQFASESIDVEINYKTGFNIEVADIVLFGSPGLQVADSKNASRDFEPRLFEVINKSMNIKTGDIKLRLLDTGFGVDGRYGTVSPNSFLDSGSTTTSLKVKNSFYTGEFEIERDKWAAFIGEEIVVRNSDFSFSETTRITEFDNQNTSRITINPPLSVAPPADYIIDLPQYPTDGDTKTNAKMKSIHCFLNPQVEVISGSSQTEFEVGAGDIDKFKVGAFVRVHDDAFTNDSVTSLVDDDAEVLQVDTGTNTITVNRDLGFIPFAGCKVDLIGFADGGLPYRLI